MLYNAKAKQALDRFYARPDTLSLGVCNGCQLMIELGSSRPATSVSRACCTTRAISSSRLSLGVRIEPNESVMLRSLAGCELGIWVAHGEGRFSLPYEESRYCIPVRYSYDRYPANPNGSDYNAAALCSEDGRHLAIMPHLERAIRPWNWACYPEDRAGDEVTPWIEAFVSARRWIEDKTKK